MTGNRTRSPIMRRIVALSLLREGYQGMVFEASAKAQSQSPTLFRNAEALLPSAKAEGSHQTRGFFSGSQADTLALPCS